MKKIFLGAVLASAIACQAEQKNKNLLLAGLLLLSGGSSSSGSSTAAANEILAQKVTLTNGQAFTYEIDLTGAAGDFIQNSGSAIHVLHQKISSTALIRLTVLTPAGIAAKTVSNNPGIQKATLNYTPTQNGVFIVLTEISESVNPATIQPAITGGTKESEFGKAASVISAKYPDKTAGFFVDSSYAFAWYGNIGSGTFSPISGATLKVIINGTTEHTLSTYESVSSFPQFGSMYTKFSTITDFAAGNTIKFTITDSANSVSYESPEVTIPTRVTGVTVAGTTLAANNTAVSVDRNSSNTVSWTLPGTAAQRPTALAIVAGDPITDTTNTSAIRYVYADPSTTSKTMEASFGSHMTTANNKDCYGIFYGASGNRLMMLDFPQSGTVKGVNGSTGVVNSIANVNMAGTNILWGCETNYTDQDNTAANLTVN